MNSQNYCCGSHLNEVRDRPIWLVELQQLIHRFTQVMRMGISGRFSPYIY